MSKEQKAQAPKEQVVQPISGQQTHPPQAGQRPLCQLAHSRHCGHPIGVLCDCRGLTWSGRQAVLV
jgi:hypothetical protein